MFCSNRLTVIVWRSLTRCSQVRFIYMLHGWDPDTIYRAIGKCKQKHVPRQEKGIHVGTNCHQFMKYPWMQTYYVNCKSCTITRMSHSSSLEITFDITEWFVICCIEILISEAISTAVGVMFAIWSYYQLDWLTSVTTSRNISHCNEKTLHLAISWVVWHQYPLHETLPLQWENTQGFDFKKQFPPPGA